MHVVIDAVVIIISYLAAWLLKFVGPFSGDAVRSLSFEWYMTALFGIVPVYLILYYAFNLYTPKRVQGRRLEFSNIVKANTVGLLLLIGGIYVLLKEINFSRDMLFYFYFINMCLEELVRMAIRYLLRDIRKRGLNQKHILLVGYSKAAEGISTGSWKIRSGVIRFGESSMTMWKRELRTAELKYLEESLI